MEVEVNALGGAGGWFSNPRNPTVMHKLKYCSGSLFVHADDFCDFVILKPGNQPKGRFEWTEFYEK